MVLRGSTVTHQFLRARLTLLIGLTLVVDAVGTVLMYWFEGGAGARTSTTSAARCSGSRRS